MSKVFYSLSSGTFLQDWSNAGLITTDDNWDNVPSIIGYRGDDVTSAVGANLTTLTGDGTVTIDVNANQTAPNTYATGGVAEFAISDPTIALNGSGTADAPYIVLYLDATGRKNIHLELDVRDLDASTDNAVQQFNVQYRIGDSGAWSNVQGGYFADVTTGPSLATAVTHVSVDLAAAANGQGQLEIRLMTTNAAGNDEWIGLDNIKVTSDAQVGSSVTVGNVSVVEGDTGDQFLVFTVTRSNADGAFTVDFATQNGTATAGSDYVANSGTLTFTAGGALTQTVSVAVHGDTVVEPNETLSLQLSNLQSSAGTATLVTTAATGTITNDDFTLLAIHDIQGAGHTSAFVGQHVVTSGIVTAIDTTGARGFWIQDPNPDANDATSEAVFVFTNAAPTVSVGDSVRVEGNVSEFAPGGGTALTVTEIDAPVTTVLSSGNALPAAIIIGTGGRLPPTSVIDNDHFTVFDPQQDGIDFYESLEGMRVTVPDAQATAATVGNTTWIVGNLGANATGMNAAGGITISANDFNPERVQIFFDAGVSPAGVQPLAVTGDHLGDVTGIVTYYGGDYELLPTAIGSTGSGLRVLPREITTLTGDADHITVGALNVENLDPFDSPDKINALADNIRVNLASPDIIGVEEIQDADGPGAGTNYSGAASAQKLIDAIAAAGGPHYLYVEVAPTANNTTGGEPNGNIRQGYLYNPERVSFVSVSQISDTTPANGDTYLNSRKPLVGEFTFHGETITLVDVHNTSRLGSDSLYSQDQPAMNAGDDRRIEQTSFIKTYVEGLVAADSHAKVVVLGDFNAFQFETSLTQLESGGALTNLTNLLPANERYSYNFDGNNQQLDHILATPDLYASAQFDIVHINANQAAVNQTTDHDGSVSRFFVNLAPTATADTGAVNENGAVTLDVLANDNDANTVDTKTLVSVSATTLGGHVSIVNNKAVYVADADNFGVLTLGQHATDSFTYVMRDAAGETSTATVSVTVNGVADGPSQTYGSGADSVVGTTLDEKIDGGAGNDTIDGGAGADSLTGGLGNDSLVGGAGLDSISAGDGNDTLVGGAGPDVLGGGRGLDTFVFGPNFGHDTVIDFAAGQDHAQFLGVAGLANYADVQAHAIQSGANVIITDTAGDTVQLNNIQLTSLHAADFLFA